MTDKFIVTTSIYPPLEATLKYAAMKDWMLIVVGDLKTPHDEYRRNPNIIYLDPEYQEGNYSELSEAIGWNKVMRRNIGFIEAYKLGAEIVATIDDDNIPYDNWGKDIRVGKETEVAVYDTFVDAFDPMQLTNKTELWHRGYPLQTIKESKTILYRGKEKRKILFQADLWDGDPDVDAVCRLIHQPKDLKLEIVEPFTSYKYIPFNSQNTFVAREALPYYMVLPHVGRMDDIWGGYIAQYLLNTRPLFMPATVKQERNIQSINKNLEDEVLGYTRTINLVQNLDSYELYLPELALKAFQLYRKEYEKIAR